MDKEEKLIEMVESFCDEYLDEEYKDLSVKLVQKMGRKHNVPFNRGKLEIWASSVIYALGQINFLFDESFEPYISRDDICDYFNTKKSTVSNKAKNIREMFNLGHFDKEFSVKYLKNSEPKFSMSESGFIIPDTMNEGEITFEDLLMEFLNDLGESNEDVLDLTPDERRLMTIEDYQEYIDNFKEEKGKAYFEENEGYFWSIGETRKFMTCLFDQSLLFWLEGEKDKSINQMKYILKLNPGDNQGVRYTLLIHLLELNRLDEAESLFIEYDDDYSATWLFSELLIYIKINESKENIKEKYEECIEYNEYVVPFLVGENALPPYQPPFYGMGDENEAIIYADLAIDSWNNDKKAMKVLKDLYTNKY